MIDMGLLWRRWLRATAPVARNGPLIALTGAVAIGLEVFCWAYLFQTNHARAEILGLVIPQALIEGIIVSAQSLLALIAAFVAAERRTDARRDQRRAARIAQTLAIVLLIPPVLKAADGFAFPQQIDAAAAFAQSEEATALRRIGADPRADSQNQLNAAYNLARATPPTRARLDGTWLLCLIFAAFLYGVNMAAGSYLWRAKPETPAERERRHRVEDRERRAENKRLALMVELQKARPDVKPSWLRGIFQGNKAA